METILEKSGKRGLLAVLELVQSQALPKRDWHPEAANEILGKFAALSKDFASGMEEDNAGKLIRAIVGYVEQGAATERFGLVHVDELLDDLIEFHDFHGSMAASMGLYTAYAKEFVETKTKTKVLRR
ncbi:MAG: hypothetical protein LVQ95_03645 [Candidatus Micrarchaeales archaeon]|nr:hypothetical protein [Candidatus Micrarchaeales archaeon]